MARISKHDHKLAEALRREGVWFRQQARCRLHDGRLFLADFYLRTKRGHGVIVTIGAPETAAPLLRDRGYKVVTFTYDRLSKDARGAARTIKSRFNLETQSENRKKIRAELREIRALLNAHEGSTARE